jgi:pyruvate/2-oxoglutarate dehydrogenase complex dihydrolipoamide acyltransferase (E2) component
MAALDWYRGTGVCALLAAAVALSACGGDSATKPAASGVQGGSEIAAEPVNSAGDNPFTAPAGKDMKGIEPPAGAVGMGGPASYRGGLPGLYGGTRDYATCDAEKLIVFLEGNPDKASAWAGTLGIPVHGIRRYISHLTPVLLRTDTRVTNHGYVNGRATPIQSVLQAGTAVFVTDYGEPVVKCYCGNPLTPPTLYRTPTYVGPRWHNFTTTHITIINRSITIIDSFTLYDPRTGTTFVRPAGTSGGSDTATGQSLPEPMNPSTTPSAPPPTQQPPPDTTPSQPAQENPAASFSPNPGQQGDNFTLSVSGFRPGANVDMTLTRPDGHVEHYPIAIGGDGRGAYTFTNTGNVITGTYSAAVTNPSTGATAHASVQVLPSGGP